MRARDLKNFGISAANTSASRLANLASQYTDDINISPEAVRRVLHGLQIDPRVIAVVREAAGGPEALQFAAQYLG